MRWVAAICRRWVDDGKPKVIVRVPPMRGGKSGTLVHRLTESRAFAYSHVLDATGSAGADTYPTMLTIRLDAGINAENIC